MLAEMLFCWPYIVEEADAFALTDMDQHLTGRLQCHACSDYNTLTKSVTVHDLVFFLKCSVLQSSILLLIYMEQV